MHQNLHFMVLNERLEAALWMQQLLLCCLLAPLVTIFGITCSSWSLIGA
jgi:hypothetical protein